MISLLRVIANQNYTNTLGFINVTSPVLCDDAFKAPEWAVRVNILWFSSLILSLATASIGMLVKSWLREYMTLHTGPPRKRLRTRFYREPAMKTWKVFEIIYVLPLLLQLALAFFFVGLCIFTATVDVRVGNTSFPLVLAWGFFLAVTTLGPVLSPRCPFRVHSFNTLLIIGRRGIRRTSFFLYPVLAEYAAVGFRFISSFWRRENWFNSFTDLPIMENTASFDWDISADEEQHITSHGGLDVSVLISTDAALVDDDLISIMQEMIKQKAIKDPSEILMLVERFAVHRDGVVPLNLRSDYGMGAFHFQSYRDEVVDPELIFPDLRALPIKPYLALMDVVLDVIKDISGAISIPSSIEERHVQDDDASAVHLPRLRPNVRVEDSISHTRGRLHDIPLWYDGIHEHTYIIARRATLFLLSDSVYPINHEFDDTLTTQLCVYLESPLEQARPIHSVRIISRMLERRAHTFNVAVWPNNILDLGTISEQAYMAIIGIIISTIQNMHHSSDYDGIQDVHAILLAKTSTQYSVQGLVNDEVIAAVCHSFNRFFGTSPIYIKPEIIVYSVRWLIERILNSRLPQPEDCISMPSFNAFSSQVHRNIMSIFAQALRVAKENVMRDSSNQDWYLKAVIYLFSDSSQTSDSILIEESIIEEICHVVKSTNLRPTLVLGWIINIFKYRFQFDIRSCETIQSIDVDIPEDVYNKLMDLLEGVLEEGAAESKLTDEDKRHTLMLLLSSRRSVTPSLSDPLVTQMCNVMETLNDASDVIQLALILIRKMSGLAGPIKRLHGGVDLMSLSKDQYTSVINAVANTILRRLNTSPTSVPQVWVHNATLILLSKAEYPLPNEAVTALQKAFDSDDSSKYANDVITYLLGLKTVTASTFSKLWTEGPTVAKGHGAWAIFASCYTPLLGINTLNITNDTVFHAFRSTLR